MVYLWEIADDYPESLLGEYDREHGPDRFGFKQGKRYDPPAEKPCFVFKASVAALQSQPDLGNSAMVPLVNPEVASVLSDVCGDEVQLLPCDIQARDGVINDYHIVVVTNKIKGLDHEQSKYSRIPGTDAIMSFTKAVYFPECLSGLSIARDEEYLSNLLVSERLYESLVKFGGLGLYSQDEMSWTE